LSKKQKKTEPKITPTKHQLSKWQRQKKVSRIIIIAAAVFLGGILAYVGQGYYHSNIKPFRETVIQVNDSSFDMGYYVDMLDAQTKRMEPNQFYAQYVTTQIEQIELIKQGANDMGIEISKKEVDAKIKELDLPNSKIYQDLVTSELTREKLLDYFTYTLPAEMEQAHIEIMPVESQEVAHNVVSQLEAGEDFKALQEEFSCSPNEKGDQGWLPAELMPSAIGDIFASLKSGEITNVRDKEITKNVGYWLIKVTREDEEKGIFAYAMLLPSKEEAIEVRDKLEAGGDFSELAKEYSQHESKDNGGELGWIKEGDMNSKVFDDIAFKLKLDEVSEPIKDESVSTNDGYWVIKVLDKGQHGLNDKVKESLAKKEFSQWLLAQKESSTINDYLDQEKISWAILKVMQRR